MDFDTSKASSQVKDDPTVSKQEMPIFSIDIHPDGSRFATGGQGVGSGRVVIWNMAPVISIEAANDEKVPKILCQLDNHLACVNCVRWSYSGKNLATGGDDKLIMIWVFAKYPSGGNPVFGGKGQANVETWRCVSTLRGHHGDVLDMAWSPHDTWLATCSIDNSVIVWNAAKFPEIVAVLKGHTGLVKGVTWDPVGKYLSSQADDKSIIIWRTMDWQQEAVIKKPFQECGGTTLVLRLSWSPDGQYLVSAHAMNGSGPTAQIIEREGWRHDIDFVGHRKAVTCVRFNANIFQRYYQCLGKSMQACCLAIGSRDRSISVWMTALKRPLFVMTKVFSRPVLDISWSGNGYQLMACSGDGTVAFLEFTEQELGKALTLEEKSALYEKIYGKSLVGGQTSSTMVLENPNLLTPEYKESQPEPYVAKKPTPSPVKVLISPMTKASTNKQIETRTSDGRRRITPIFIPLAPDTGEGPTPFGSDSVPFSSSSESKSRIVIERREDVVVIPNVTPVKSSPSQNGQSPKVVHKTCQIGDKSLTSATSERCLTAVKGNSDKLITANMKRPRFSDNRFVTMDTIPVTVVKKTISNDTEQLIDAISLPLMRLPMPYIQTIPSTKKKVTIENEVLPSPHGNLTVVKMSNDSKKEWKIALSSPVCCIAINPTVVAIGCEDGSVHVLYGSTGCRVLPTMILSRPCTEIALGIPVLLMCLTTNGYISVWDLATSKVMVSNQSIEPIMISPPGMEISINRCWLSDQGAPLIALSTGKAFMYSLQLNTWMLLGDCSDPVVRNSQKAVQTAWKNVPEVHSPLKNLQSQIQNTLSMESSRFIPNFENSPLCTLTYLDHQLSACKALYSSQEYRFWLLTTVKFLLQEGYETKLRLMCEELLGPTYGTYNYKHWDKSVLGLEKHGLLKDVLAEMSNSLHAQRLFTEFNEQLNIIKKST